MIDKRASITFSGDMADVFHNFELSDRTVMIVLHSFGAQDCVSAAISQGFGAMVDGPEGGITTPQASHIHFAIEIDAI